MGKQLSIYLDDTEVKLLTEMARKQCRRLHDQALYILRCALFDEPTPVTQASINDALLRASSDVLDQCLAKLNIEQQADDADPVDAAMHLAFALNAPAPSANKPTVMPGLKEAITTGFDKE